MLTTESFQDGDVAFGRQLSDVAGWNQTVEDWKRLVALDPSGCFVARRANQPVGTVMTCRFGAVAWIGMMLVDPRWRRQGIGRALMNRALDYLDNHGVTSVRLDATSLGQPLYKSMGFQQQFEVRRYAGNPFAVERAASVRPAQTNDYMEVLALDRQVVGYDRSRLLESLWNNTPRRCLVAADESGISGYIMRRPGRLASMIGPCIAIQSDGGRSLLAAALNETAEQDVFVDVPTGHTVAEDVVRQVGLEPIREFQRMARGNQVIEAVSGLFASSGPELG